MDEARQRELFLLSSFISEQEEWLRNLLNALGWSIESQVIKKMME